MFFNKDGNIDNINIPDEFIEISSLLKLHNKEIKKKMLKLLHKNFNQDDEESQKKIMEILEYSVFLETDYRRSFFINIVGNALEIKKSYIDFICCIIELLNIYTIVQNAMPNISNDDYINNKETCHKKFGTSQTTIAMTALFNLINSIITDSDIITISDKDRCKLIKIISKYNGKDGVNGGQMMQVLFKKHCSQDEKNRIKKLNFNSLFLAGNECLAILGNISSTKTNAIKTYINNLCNIMNSYDDIKNDSNNGNEILQRVNLLTQQSIQNVSKINNNNKLIAFAKYCNYCIEKQIENNKLSKPFVITSDVQKI